MEAKINLIDPLIERVEQYGKTSFELVKLKTIYKTADISSSLISRLIIFGFIFLFIIMLNIAVGLLLGDILGKNYIGFLLVALFYGLTGMILYFVYPAIKKRINNLFVLKMLT